MLSTEDGFCLGQGGQGNRHLKVRSSPKIMPQARIALEVYDGTRIPDFLRLPPQTLPLALKLEKDLVVLKHSLICMKTWSGIRQKPILMLV